MSDSIPVMCLIDRYWDPAAMKFAGTDAKGDLLEITAQSAENDSGRLVPVGIVMMNDGTFQSIPIEFIRKV